MRRQSNIQLLTKFAERSPADKRQRHRLVHGVCIHRIAVIAQGNILSVKRTDRPILAAIGKIDILRQTVDPRPQLGRRHALAPPPFVIRGQPPIALTLRHPSALIAIVLRSNKLQIALTNQPNNNIYECKNHISFLLSQSRFSSVLSYYQSASPISRTVQRVCNGV